MFEFLKKLSFENNINDDGKRIVSGSYNSVGYTGDKYVFREIDRWMKLVGIYNISFGELLCKLGFVKYKTLWFDIVSSSEDKILLSYGYQDNLYEGDKLELSLRKTYSNLHRLEPDSYEIKISGDNYERIYGIKSDISLEDRIKLFKKKDYIKESIEDKTYTRRIQDNGFRIIINHMFNDEINLECHRYNLLEIKNEQELKEYLLNIDDNVSVKEVYKKICELSLGDENLYNKIDLSLKKNNKISGSILLQTKGNYSMFGPKYKYEVLENGDKVCFYMTLPEKTLYCDENIRVVEVRKNDYRIEIKLSSFGTKEEFTKMLALRDYLMNLDFPVKINELCKTICDRCLIDINSIPYFKIECFYGNTFTDWLLIEEGKLNDFHMTIDGKNIKIDNDGNFYYGYSSLKGEVSIDMDMNQDVVTRYEVALDNGIENEDMANSMYNAIREAKDAKVRTRKMIDEMFRRNDN